MTMKSFFKSFYKCAGLAEVSTVALIDGDKMLMGKRRDNDRWTNPGGHLDPGEDPLDGALREVWEESGIQLEKGQVKHLRTEKVTTPTGKQLIIHAYKAKVSNVKSSMKNDPDQEVHRWQWVNIKNGLPKEIAENLHSPRNTMLKGLGLQDEEDHTKVAAEEIKAEDLAYLYANHEARETPAQEKKETPKEQKLEAKIGIEPPVGKKGYADSFSRRLKKSLGQDEKNAHELPSFFAGFNRQARKS